MTQDKTNIFYQGQMCLVYMCASTPHRFPRLGNETYFSKFDRGCWQHETSVQFWSTENCSLQHRNQLWLSFRVTNFGRLKEKKKRCNQLQRFRLGMQILCCMHICDSLPGCCQECARFKPCFCCCCFVLFGFCSAQSCLHSRIQIRVDFKLKKSYCLEKLFRVIASYFHMLEL